MNLIIALPNSEIPYKMRHFQLCIDSFEKEEPEGRLYSGINQSACEFNSVMPLLHAIEDQLNKDSSMPRFEENRSLCSCQEIPYEVNWRNLRCIPGRMANFMLEINFRQNTTWQGEITWIEKKRSVCFRSALEMLFILTDALKDLIKKNPNCTV